MNDAMLRNAVANAQNPYVGVIGAQSAPEGPADKVMRTLNAFASALREARAAGWSILVSTEDDEISIHASKQTVVTVRAK